MSLKDLLARETCQDPCGPDGVTDDSCFSSNQPVNVEAPTCKEWNTGFFENTPNLIGKINWFFNSITCALNSLENTSQSVEIYESSGTIEYTSEDLSAMVIVQGGGGNGGDATQGIAPDDASAGSGGNSGATAVKFISAPQNATTIVGAAGGNTTYSDGVNSITAEGGADGLTLAPSTATISRNPDQAISAAIGGDISITGSNGGTAFAKLARSLADTRGNGGYSGSGANSFFGSGGLSIISNAGVSNVSFAGFDASGYGAGGSGGYVAGTAASVSGGQGGQGVVIVVKFKRAAL